MFIKIEIEFGGMGLSGAYKIVNDWKLNLVQNWKSEISV